MKNRGIKAWPLLACLLASALHGQSLESAVKTKKINKRLNLIRTKLAGVSKAEVVPVDMPAEEATNQIARIPEINQELFESMKKITFVPSLKQLAFLRLEQSAASALAAYHTTTSSTETPKPDRDRILRMFADPKEARSADRLVELAKLMDEEEAKALDENIAEDHRDSAVESYATLRREALKLSASFNEHVKRIDQIALNNFLSTNAPLTPGQKAIYQVPTTWHLFAPVERRPASLN